MEEIDYSRVQIRTIILYLYSTGKTAAEIHAELEHSMHGNPPSLATVNRWVQRFRTENYGIEDEPKSGRPSLEIGPLYGDRLRAYVEENPNASLRELARFAGCSMTTVGSVMHDELGYTKTKSKWVAKR